MAGWAAFCAASWQARDEFVGWSADARVANLRRMINNNRFLLLPGVRVHGLASYVLGLAATRLPGDWEAAYGVRPAYTYVSPDQRLLSRGRVGALRQVDVRVAAGCRGEGRRTVGRSRWPPTGRSGCAGSRSGRSASPRKRLRPTIGGSTVAERTRTDAFAVVRMGRAWEKRPGQPVPVIFPDKDDQKAAYRLLSNSRVNMDHVLESHKECMVERCRKERVVLAVQDTTMLNYNGLEATSGLVPLGGGGSGTKGIAAHFGLATARRPLGVFEATMRDDKGESESVRWPLRQGTGNRARLSRHEGRHRMRPGRGWSCCRGRLRRALACWCAPAVRSGGACCAKTARKRTFGATWRSSRR